MEEWTQNLTKFVTEDAETGYEAPDKKKFGWDDIRKEGVALIKEAPGAATSDHRKGGGSNKKLGEETEQRPNKPEDTATKWT